MCWKSIVICCLKDQVFAFMGPVSVDVRLTSVYSLSAKFNSQYDEM